MKLNEYFEICKERQKKFNYDACVILNLSNVYIHLYWTGPPTFTSNNKCMGRYFIESNTNGENIISKFAYCLDDIRFKPFHVLCLQLVEAYISKEETDLCEYIS
jgi:hypothetical protein